MPYDQHNVRMWYIAIAAFRLRDIIQTKTDDETTYRREYHGVGKMCVAVQKSGVAIIRDWKQESKNKEKPIK